MASAGGTVVFGSDRVHFTLGETVAGPEAGFWANASVILVGVDDDTTADAAPIPSQFRLGANSPNPFSATTVIAYDIPAGGGWIRIAVYDLGGRLVRTLVNGVPSPGRKEVSWDGLDDGGVRLRAGIYFCTLEATGYKSKRRLALIH